MSSRHEEPRLHPAMPLLLAILREEEPEPAPGPADWAAAVHLAEQHGIAPYFAVHAQKLRSAATWTAEPGSPNPIADRERQAVREAFFWTAELRGLLAGFAVAGLPVLPLKGPMLAQRVYGGATLRSCRDLDLLVRRPDFAAATAVLRGVGFTPVARADDYHQPWARGGTGVELHFDVHHPLALPFRIAEAFARASQVSFAGQPALQFSPGDELVYLCLHCARHRFARLSHVLDIARALGHLPPGARKQANREHPELRPVLLLGCFLATRFCLPADIQPGISAEKNKAHQRSTMAAHVSRFADQLWADLMHAEPLPGELDWAEQHRFLASLHHSTLTRARVRFRHGSILLTRLLDLDYRFAARFGISQPALVWVLRQVRLAAKLARR